MSSICCAAFLVYFLTMASQTGCETMNSVVAGSIFTVFSVKRNKRSSSRSRTCKTQPLKNNDESNIGSLQVTPIPKKSHWILSIPLAFLTSSGKYVRFSGGECGGKPSLEGNNSSSICCAAFLVYFLTNSIKSTAAGRTYSSGRHIVN